jgi:cell division protein FtsZ
MAEMGKAMMGTGEAEGENRAIRAAEAAINNPLLEDTSMAGARGLLINITGGDDLTLFEVDQAANRIREEVDEEANVIFGSAVDESLTGRIRVSVVATGIDSPRTEQQRPRLVAVGGSAAPAPQPIHVPATMAAQAAGGVSPAPVTAAMPLRQQAVAMQGEAMPVQDSMAEAGMMQSQPQGMPHQGGQPIPLRQPTAAPQAIPRPGLFTDGSRPASAPPVATPLPSAEPQRPSLFSTVTGAFRRRQPAQTAGGEVPNTAVRREPSTTEMHAEIPRASVRQTHAVDEVGIEIPAFLRRQSS